MIDVEMGIVQHPLYIQLLGLLNNTGPLELADAISVM